MKGVQIAFFGAFAIIIVTLLASSTHGNLITGNAIYDQTIPYTVAKKIVDQEYMLSTIKESGLTKDHDWFFLIEGHNRGLLYVTIDEVTGFITAVEERRHFTMPTKRCASQKEIIAAATERIGGTAVKVLPFLVCGRWDVYVETSTGLAIVNVDSRHGVVDYVRRTVSSSKSSTAQTIEVNTYATNKNLRPIANKDIRSIILNEVSGKISLERNEGDYWRFKIRDSNQYTHSFTIDAYTGLILTYRGKTSTTSRSCLSQKEAINAAKKRYIGEPIKAKISKVCGTWEVHLIRDGKVKVHVIDSRNGIVRRSWYYYP